MSKPKETSWDYGQDYQLHQAEKYRNRNQHSWKPKIELAHKLIEQHVLPRFPGRQPGDIVVVDVGCSVGTFALEFSRAGYQAYGVDFDSSALEIGRQLAAEEGLSPEFICADISNMPDGFPPIDMAVCFDIFEHLHDDELGSLLRGLGKLLSEQGCIVFFTTPTEYDYIFNNRYRRVPLLPFMRLSPRRFTVLAKVYRRLFDIGLLLTKGVTYRESIAREGHCNPLTVERLNSILERAGYSCLSMESADLFETRPFSRQPIAHKHIYGVAVRKQ